MNITPLRDRVIVKPLDPETLTKGGIVIPDNVKNDLKAMKAEVIASGEGRITDDGTLVPNTVKAGKTILYGQYTGSKVKFEDEEYVILKEDEILAIID
jgi:chaperonin GroES